MSGRFPWEDLKAECMRLVCIQITGGLLGLTRKEEMVDFFREVDKKGLDAAMAGIEHTDPKASNAKQKRKLVELPTGEDQDSDEDDAPAPPESNDAYNTRFKGSKRVKLTKPEPEGYSSRPRRRPSRPRKSAPASLPSLKAKIKTGVSNQSKTNGPLDKSKRPRGRPPKSGLSAKWTSKSEVSKTRARRVFDGVVLSTRNKHHSATLPPHSAISFNHDPDADAEGDVVVEAEQEVLWTYTPPSEPAAQQLPQNGIEVSSIGDSNKENEVISQPNGHLPIDNNAEPSRLPAVADAPSLAHQS